MISSIFAWVLGTQIGRIVAAGAIACITCALVWPLAHGLGYAAGKADSALKARAERAEAEANTLRRTLSAHQAAAAADTAAAATARVEALALQEQIRDILAAPPAGPCLDAALSDRLRNLWPARP